MKPTETQQSEALLAAMATILWNIGEKAQVTVVLPGDVPLIVHSHAYFQDSVTEKVKAPDLHKELKVIKLKISLQLFLFIITSLDDLQIFLKRYLYFVSNFLFYLIILITFFSIFFTCFFF